MGNPFFELRDMVHSAFGVHLVELQAASFGNALTVPEHREQQASVAGLISTALGGLDQSFDLAGGDMFSLVHESTR